MIIYTSKSNLTDKNQHIEKRFFVHFRTHMKNVSIVKIRFLTVKLWNLWSLSTQPMKMKEIYLFNWKNDVVIFDEKHSPI